MLQAVDADVALSTAQKQARLETLFSLPPSATEMKRAPRFQDALSLCDKYRNVFLYQNNREIIAIIETSDGGTWHPRPKR